MIHNDGKTNLEDSFCCQPRSKWDSAILNAAKHHRTKEIIVVEEGTDYSIG